MTATAALLPVRRTFRQPWVNDCFGAMVEMNVGYGAASSTGRSWPGAEVKVGAPNDLTWPETCRSG
jgi:hypothetical protein